MKKQKTRIAIAGSMGRMGKILIQEIQKNQNACLSTALVQKNDLFIDQDIGEVIGIGKIGVLISDNINETNNHFDVLIDFTTPNSTLNYIKICAKLKKNIVIGTTGFSIQEKKIITSYANQIGIVLSSNFSIGMNLLFKLVKKATQIIGSNSDIEIIESHHRNKIDAPSGTALEIGEIISKVMKVDLKNNSIYSREKLNQIREKNKIGFSTIRAGDIVGKHTVLFASTGEQINITHTASNRNAFSKGAIHAAIWLHKKNLGIFDMAHVLDF